MGPTRQGGVLDKGERKNSLGSLSVGGKRTNVEEKGFFCFLSGSLSLLLGICSRSLFFIKERGVLLVLS